MLETKVCTKCKQVLPTNVFGYDKARKDNLNCQCKSCIKIYYDNNREKFTAKRRQYELENKEKIQIYLEKNKQMISEKAKLYKENNKETIREYKKWYNANNKDKAIILARRHEALKRSLPRNFTSKQWEYCKKYFNNKCAYCGQELPLAQEHFLALSKGGEYTNNNIIPSCRSCNSSKHNRDFFEWYPKHKSYDSKREKKILKYLHYDGNIQQLRII